MINSAPTADALSRNRIGNVGFAASHVLPGEDPHEVVAIFKHLAEEHSAQGHLESDAVLTMAAAVWRKQNLSVYKLAAEARARYGHFFKFPNDRDGFWKYDFEEMRWALYAHIEAVKKRLKSNESTQSDAEKNETENWIHSDDFKIDPRLLGAEAPQIFAMAEATQRATTLMSQVLGAEILEELNQAKKEVPVRDPLINLALLAELLTPECPVAELDMVKRLDDTIDRSYNRLMKFQATRAPSAPLSVSPLLQHLKLSRNG